MGGHCADEFARREREKEDKKVILEVESVLTLLACCRELCLCGVQNCKWNNERHQ